MAKKNKPSKLGEILKNITKQSIKDNAAKEREKSYDIRKIFEQMELDLISSMRRAFYFHQNEQEKEGFEWEQWQLSKLRAMEQYRKRNRKIVSKYNKPIQEAIDRELRENFSKGESRVERFIDKVKQLLKWRKREYQSIEFPQDIDTSTLKGYIAKELGSQGAVPQEKNFFGVNEKKLEALISTVNNDLNKAQYSVLRKMDDVYRQTIFKTHMYLQNGAKTLNQAIDMATKDFLDKGINSIEYKNGARVNISSYAEMALRTANHRAMLLGEGKKRDEYGIHLVVVSAHANTCPKCEPWQGKIVIDDIFSHPSTEYIEKYKDKYKLLSEAIDKGLLHPNCRHALITYFEGITTLPVVPDGKEAIKTYEAEQKQRLLERQIRKWKRIEAGSVDAKNVNDAAKKVKELEYQLTNHLDKNKQLRRAPQREIDKIPIDKVSSSDKIIDRKWLKANFSTQKKYDRHIEKHLSEYGDITPEDYLNTARDLLAAPLSNDIEGFISKDGFTFKYRISTNDFTVGRADGKISTLFKPDKNIEYWKEQISLYKNKEE
ncbi:MAG: phage minor capsid protein [Clostridium sp.]|uniref:phage minor capsid protein n=1 Tax=Clostridium TaxID=1485 RepID=UPI00290AAB51|nr:phage minor capsid protein [Clostridium sp.]MDU7086191.1 phage minor capsid protein [Clostridium sp.]